MLTPLSLLAYVAAQHSLQQIMQRPVGSSSCIIRESYGGIFHCLTILNHLQSEEDCISMSLRAPLYVYLKYTAARCETNDCVEQAQERGERQSTSLRPISADTKKKKTQDCITKDFQRRLAEIERRKRVCANYVPACVRAIRKATE